MALVGVSGALCERIFYYWRHRPSSSRHLPLKRVLADRQVGDTLRRRAELDGNAVAGRYEISFAVSRLFHIRERLTTPRDSAPIQGAAFLLIKGGAVPLIRGGNRDTIKLVAHPAHVGVSLSGRGSGERDRRREGDQELGHCALLQRKNRSSSSIHIFTD